MQGGFSAARETGCSRAERLVGPMAAGAPASRAWWPAPEPGQRTLKLSSYTGTFGRGVMNADFFRRFAQQCRELIARARTEPAKEQLRIWAEEFDARADALERAATEGPADQQ